jgi:hypothetical protein
MHAVYQQRSSPVILIENHSDDCLPQAYFNNVQIFTSYDLFVG